MRCGFTCVNPKFCACLTFYLLCSLLMLGFLYLYGSTIIAQISRLLRIMIHALLPASWLKSTKDIINEALYKYNADRLGLADYALESAGGSILCSSETYYSKSGPLYSIFGIPLWYHASSPREVIQPDVAPGKCWAMDGSQGFVTIQLAMPVVVTAVSLEHIPKELSPSGKLYSAPRDFYIVGRERGMDSPELILGSYTYRVGQDPIQVFEIKDPFCLMKSVTSDICGVNQHVFNIITLKIMNNYGNPDYTCIYRLRVHGKPTSLIE
ncbi:unnamed protein product [Lymnaea stagnalis]|uniref:SUN domain-containing protein n=1 Tax=Lymnaea stagnalis TaxID=6523 RepID=A0AAV2I8N0_LYMST